MSEPKEGSSGKVFTLGRTLPLIVLLCGLIVVLSMGWHRYLSLTMLRDNRDWLLSSVEAYGALAGAAFVLLYALIAAFSIPGGLILTVSGGFLFGTLEAAVYVVIGATLGATGIFLAAKTALGDVLHARAGPALQKMEAGFRENALSYLLVLRLIPLFPFWLVNIVPAFLGVPLRTYVIGTFFGIIPGVLVFASVGSSIGGVLDSLDPDEPPDLGSIIFQPENLLPLLGLAALSLLPIVYRRIKARRARRDP